MTTCYYADCERLAEVQAGSYVWRCTGQGCRKPFCDEHKTASLCRRCDPWQPRVVYVQGFGRAKLRVRIERVASVTGLSAAGYGQEPPRAARIRPGSLVCHHIADELPFEVEAVAVWRAETVEASGLEARDIGRVDTTEVLLPPPKRRWIGSFDPHESGWVAACGYWTADLVLSVLRGPSEPMRTAEIVERIVYYASDLGDRKVRRQANSLLVELLSRGLVDGGKRRGWWRLAERQTRPELRVIDGGGE